MSGNEQLMGSQPGQLNIRAQRQRAQELAELIDSLLYQLRVAPHTLNWNDVVDKVAVINVQLHQLQEELRPVSYHYALHPKSVNAQNAATIPIMLASMLYPEQQACYDEAVKGVTTKYEDWKSFVEDICGGNSRKAARRRGIRVGGVAVGGGLGHEASAAGGKHARRTGQPGGATDAVVTVDSPMPLDDAEEELLNVVSFGGLK